MRPFRRLRHAARKLARVFRSDLAGADRFWYLLDEALERTGLRKSGVRAYRLQDGSTIYLRRRTTDGKVFEEVYVDCIYAPFVEAIPDSQLPSVLVDLGANIGLSTLFLDRRLGFDRVIAVEPDFDNLQLLRRNLEDNLDAPCESVQVFAGGARGYANMLDAGFGAWGLRMGNATDSGIPVLPLQEIVPHAAGGVLLKCDIEGAERYVFPRIAEWDHLVNFIILELHTEFFSVEQLRAALEASHYEWCFHGGARPGAVLAVFALERGAWKADAVMSGAAPKAARAS